MNEDVVQRGMSSLRYGYAAALVVGHTLVQQNRNARRHERCPGEKLSQSTTRARRIESGTVRHNENGVNV